MEKDFTIKTKSYNKTLTKEDIKEIIKNDSFITISAVSSDPSINNKNINKPSKYDLDKYTYLNLFLKEGRTFSRKFKNNSIEG